MTSVARILRTLIAVLTTLWSLNCLAQQLTVGDILSKGGKVLTKDEVVSLLTGATVLGQQLNSATTFENVYSADGKVKGSSLNAAGVKGIQEGQWTVESSGRFVSNMSGANGARWKGMNYWIKLDDTYYVAETDSSSALASKREVRK